MAEGQLSMAEHEQRVKAATNAATLGDLRSPGQRSANDQRPVQLPSLRAPHSRIAVGLGNPGGRRGGAGATGHRDRLGLYGNTSSPLNFTSDPGPSPTG